MLHIFQERSAFQEAVRQLLPKINDRHNRFAIVPIENVREMQMAQGDGFAFSSLNPTGSYNLNLSVPIQRDVAKSLLLLNKLNFERIAKAESVDKSQIGNKSCFRNE
jgi:hypothetical protein